MQLEFCHIALSLRVIKTSPGLGATQLPKEASFGGWPTDYTVSLFETMSNTF